ncbi:MAG: glycoside hydrolase family 10 protein [Bacteroidota bacterium]
MTHKLQSSSPKREMRAVWIASVANIDWPSRSGLSVGDQQRELVELLDLVKEWNMNTVILQIRPAADAFFQSDLEPWSQWLTGTQGQAPDPFYDPLDFAIMECRKRGIDIHLWLNPYRAELDTARNALSEDHPMRRHPEWFVTYGQMGYFNPGLPQTRDHVSHVVADLVRRYDMDAIHFDDYFYPYPITGEEFPDSAAFAKHPHGFSPEQKDDWRRHNVDLIIKQLQDTIKSIKPHVAFGISPFGVWRNQTIDPKGSATTAGVTNYDDLYADILKWQKEGWIDYVTPQLYWHIGMPAADFSILAHWWSENTYGCHLYVGQGLYRLDPVSTTQEWRTSEEISRQLNIIRSIPNIEGSMFFSAKHLRSNPLQLKERLLQDHYRYPAIPPVNNRVQQLTVEPPSNPVMVVSTSQVKLSWERSEDHKSYVVYRFRLGKPENIEDGKNIFAITGENSIVIPHTDQTRPDWYYYMVTALSHTNQESVPLFFNEVFLP